MAAAKKNEQTSKQVARLAAIGIKRPDLLTLKEIKIVCGSVLTQRPDRTK